MKKESDQVVTISFSGQIVMNRETLVGIIREAVSSVAFSAEVKIPPQQVSRSNASERLPHLLPADKSPRMAFTRVETAEILGISPATLDRLIVRGLLRSSKALRRPLIARTEIERFLQETSKSLWNDDLEKA